METKDLVLGLVGMLKEGKIMDAFEKYYAENVVMQENDTEPRVGKEANRAFEKSFVEGITEFRDMKILGVTWGDGISMIESSMDATHKDWGVMNNAQVAVQRWENGQIVSEKFYYNKAK